MSRSAITRATLAPFTALFTAGCAAHSLQELPPAMGEDEKFRLATPDGRNVLELGALVQVLGRLSDDSRDPQDEFDLKRVRPEFSGHVAGGLAFNLEPNFGADDVELEEAWIGPELFDHRATLHLGRMKAPFNLEEVRSRRHIDFPFFSIVNQLAPAEDHGAFLDGRSASERWEYGVALYNGTGGDDTNSSKDVALRLMAHPFEGEPDNALEHLQFGLAGTAGVQDEDVGDFAIENEAKLEVVSFADDARLSGPRERLGFELAWFRGPWFVQAEYLGVEQEMAGSGGHEDVLVHGGYLTLSHVLTGEDKSFGGVVPAAPHDFASGTGRGAWVVAARYSVLDLDDDLEAALVEPGTFTDRIQTASLGLDWIPNTHSIVRTALLGSFYADEVQLDTESDDHELTLLVEFQLHY